MKTRETRSCAAAKAAAERLALQSTLALFLAYGSFVALNAFAPRLTAINLSATGRLPLGLVLGLLVILFGFVLTCIYVLRANRAELSQDGGQRSGADL